MYRDNRDQQEQNFWISYADLMAGLLFVFILVVGAIVIRYVYVQQDLERKREALGLSESALSSKNEMIDSLRQKLQDSAKRLLQADDEKDKLRQELLLKTSDVSKLKELILDYERSDSELKEKISILETNLSQNSNILILKDEEIATLGAKLLEQSKAHQLLVDELNITKVKIKNLTGIRIKVVERLKERLGDSINIDSKSGALRFSSNILFNQGSYTLKPSAKQQLRDILKRYIQTLLLDSEIRQYIDNITIEGHTNTDGSYLYNLALSQKRALEVMKFLYQSDIQNRELYSQYLSASGRSYADLIYNEFGQEDKDASRRIEIKFRIKNEKSIKELEKFLNR
jgi:chemotaxis protein MotB